MAKLKKESERGRGGTNGFLIHDHIHKKPNGVCNIMCQNNPFKIPSRFIETIKHSLQKNPHGQRLNLILLTSISSTFLRHK